MVADPYRDAGAELPGETRLALAVDLEPGHAHAAAGIRGDHIPDRYVDPEIGERGKLANTASGLERNRVAGERAAADFQIVADIGNVAGIQRDAGAIDLVDAQRLDAVALIGDLDIGAHHAEIITEHAP